MAARNDVFNFLREFDELNNQLEVNLLHIEVPDPLIPRFGNIYLRNILNPFQYYTAEDFQRRYRFKKETVRNVLVPLLEAGAQYPMDMRGLPISTEMQLLIALRFYATGCFQIVCGDLHYISQPTVSRIIKNVSAKLTRYVNDYVKFPENLEEVQDKFRQLPGGRYPGLRHIIGAIDCTHINIRQSRIVHSEVYRNRKGKFSINVQAVVGPDMKFYNVVARWPGSSHDSRIFRNSRLHADLEAGRLQGILVGDSGYRATTYMLTPFINPTEPPQIRFNYVQVRTRTVVERTFGVWKRRFGCLHVGLSTKLSTSSNIIISCAVLHNIAIDANDQLNVNNMDEPEIVPEEPARAGIIPRQGASGLAFRNMIVNQYFNNI